MIPVEDLLSREYKTIPRFDDDDDETQCKDMWNDAVDFFNDPNRQLKASQDELRQEQQAKGYVELDDDYYDKVARRSQLSLEDYLQAKAKAIMSYKTRGED
ncbi:hypothetical protein ZWY2020_016928 [Hordeum vulgare]|nr:hypothetical protein ZWY2020_016928 [Hordeum vulgare]